MYHNNSLINTSFKTTKNSLSACEISFFPYKRQQNCCCELKTCLFRDCNPKRFYNNNNNNNIFLNLQVAKSSSRLRFKAN